MRKLYSFAVVLAFIASFVAAAAEVTLPTVNTSDTGFRTVITIENLTSKPVSFGADEIPAFGRIQIERWGGFGPIRPRFFSLPAGLTSYVEMVPPGAQTILVHPLEAMPPGRYRQVIGMRAGEYSSFVVVMARETAQVSVQCFQDNGIETKKAAVQVLAGTAELVECPGVGDLRALIIAGAPVYILPVRRSLTTNEWIVLPLREVITE